MKSQLNLITRHITFAISPPSGVPYSTATTMPNFDLQDTTPKVPVSIPSGSDLSQNELLKFPAFRNWLSTLRHSLSLQESESHTFYQEPYKLRSIEIQSIDRFGGKRLGFIKFKAEITNDSGEKLPGSIFLRGGSVAMMVSNLSATF